MTVVDKPYSAIILAAGSGTRMAADRNKIFLELADQAIFTYSLTLFLSDSDCKEVILVGKAEEKQYFSKVLSDKVIFVVGGEERQDSVRHALSRVASAHVMIHDGARPFVSLGDLTHLKVHTNAILAVPVKDTIKQVCDASQIKETVPRQTLWAAQTPQFFNTSLIKTVHQTAHDAGFLGTDDASLVEQFSTVPVIVVPGSYENIKITTPEDLMFGHAILASRSTNES